MIDGIRNSWASDTRLALGVGRTLPENITQWSDLDYWSNARIKHKYPRQCSCVSKLLHVIFILNVQVCQKSTHKYSYSWFSLGHVIDFICVQAQMICIPIFLFISCCQIAVLFRYICGLKLIWLTEQWCFVLYTDLIS